MKKFRIAIFSIITVIACMSLVACGKGTGKTKKLSDIFQTRVSAGELTTMTTYKSMPKNYRIYSDIAPQVPGFPDSSSQIGYIEKYNIFVVEKVKVTDTAKHAVESEKILNVMKAGSDSLILDENLRPKQIQIAHGYIAILGSDNTVSVYNMDGRTVLSKSHFDKDKIANSAKKLTDIIKIADSDTIAVSGEYLKDGKSKTVTFFRPTTEGDVSNRGVKGNTIENPSDKLGNVGVVENTYSVVRTGSDSKQDQGGSVLWNIITGEKLIEYAKPKDAKEYTQFVSYLGMSRFYIQTNQEGKEKNYTIKTGNGKYTLIKSAFFNAANRKEYKNETGYLYGKILNEYSYNLEGREVSKVLKPGYQYCGYVVDLTKPSNPTFDQFIVDKKLKPVLSLTGNYGISVDSIKKFSEATLTDLLFDCVDDIAYVPYNPGTLRVMDKNGKLKFSNDEYIYLKAVANHGMIVCQVKKKNSEETGHVVFTYSGKKVFDSFSEDIKDIKEIEPFRGDFALVVPKYGDKYRLLSKSGTLFERHRDTGELIFHEYYDANGKKINGGKIVYTQNIYMQFKNVNGNILYGVKRIRQNENNAVIKDTIFPVGTILYCQPDNPNKVFVFEYTASGNDVIYTVHEVR